MYLLISSKGEIDPKALTLMGGSTKRNDAEKIGFFGSGNKYAIACLLREKVPFQIFSGANEIVIGTVPVKLTETSFNAITIDGRETDLTDSLGPQWELWMALRELYSNALDEGEHSMKIVDEIVVTPGITQFYLHYTPKVEKIYTSITSYFSEFRNDLLFYEQTIGEVFSKTKLSEVNIYRKGIRCNNDKVNSLFDYNFYTVDINESRLLNNIYNVYGDTCRIWASSLSVKEQDIKTLLSNIHLTNTFEHAAFGWSGAAVKYSDKWHFLKDYAICPDRFKDQVEADFYLPSDMIKGLINSGVPFKSALENSAENAFFPVDEPFLNATVQKAIDFLIECKVKITIEISVGRFVEPAIELTIINRETRKIAISQDMVEKGVKETAILIIQGQAVLNSSLRGHGRYLAQDFVTHIQKTNAYIL